MKTLQRYRYIEGAEIRAIADLNPTQTKQANAQLVQSGRPMAELYHTEGGWMQMCQRNDIDLIYICTDWTTHAAMAIYAMEHGKHVAVEVPAATSVEECLQLVATAERTQRHCFMTENCCYDFFALSTLEMARQGLFGQITHVEGAYIHELRGHLGLSEAESIRHGTWMERDCARHAGNPYPTHGMGPIGWLLNLHRGDRMDYLVSLTSRGCGHDNLLGRINTTLIHTVLGRSIVLQFDVTTPRPYSRIQVICGSKGFARKYPVATLQFEDSDILTGEEALRLVRQYETSNAAACWHRGHDLGVENEMNYAMDCRLIHCLQKGLPLDIDVYDAAEWSCITQLSEISAQNGSKPVTIPDFTNGHWDKLKGFRFFS